VGCEYVRCTVPLSYWVVVVVFELTAGATTTGGFFVSYSLVVVVSVT
jgi:hypothetical protein